MPANLAGPAYHRIVAKRGLSLSGIPVSPGVAVGRAVIWLSREDTAPRRALEAGEAPAEIARLKAAAEQAVREIETTADEVAARVGPEYAGIFHAHALLLQDRAFLGPVERRIEVDGVNAEWAVAAATDALASRFRDLPDKNLAHRAADLDDVSRILRKHLGEHGEARVEIADLPGESLVLVADELTPSDAVRIPRERVIAFVTERGGSTSHAAILARSFGIPAVVAVPRLLATVADGDRVIVDGREGVVWREPPEDVEALFRERAGKEATRERSLKARSLSGAVRTLDGEEIAVRGNIELADETRDILEYGADGVGLFRTEFLYLSANRAGYLDEEAQTALYRETLSRLAPRPVVIRTYDLGGKKAGQKTASPEEPNPVLGLRGVRLSLRKPDMFRTQLRALLAAASAGNLRILVPMISGIEEVRQVRALLEEAAGELRERGLDVPQVPLGAMIEVPSAAILADLLASEVDFMSLGTNDLIQYTLAVDRANETVSDLFRPHHPAVLRLVAAVAESGRRAGKPVSVCGEMAANPASFVLLLGVGIREFSMGSRSVPAIKEIARGVSTVHAAQLARAALSLSTADEVDSLLAREGGNSMGSAEVRGVTEEAL